MIKRIFSLIMIMTMTVTCICGCEKTSKKAPELHDMTVSSEVEYEVVTKDISDIYEAYGYIEGARCFAVASCDGTISSLYKSVGDHVNKGDTIATMVSDSVQDEYEDVLRTISSKNSQHTENIKVYNLQKDKLEAEYDNTKATYKGDDLSDKLKCIELKITQIEHDISYENKIYNFENENILKKKETLSEKIDSMAIKSPCDGTVTSLKDDTGVGTVLEEGDPYAVIISDEDKRVLIPNYGYYTDDGSSMLDEANSLEYKIGDKGYSLTQVTDSSNEKELLKRASLGSNLEFTFDGIDKYEIGDEGVVLVTEHEYKDVLAVPNDAVKRESGQAYVYVKSGEDEKRVDITTGNSTDTETEVVEGLSEGDVLVYTSYKEGNISNMLEVTDGSSLVSGEAYVGDLTEEGQEGDDGQIADVLSVDVVDSEGGGSFVEFKVARGDEVKKGQVIAVLDRNVLKSDILNAKQQVDDAAEAISKETKNYQEHFKELTTTIAEADNSYDKKQAELDLQILKAEHELDASQNSEALSYAKSSYQELLDKSNGEVVSPVSGTVTEISGFVAGDNISGDMSLVTIEDTSKRLIVSNYGGYHFGDEVEMTDGDGNEFTGTVVCSTIDINEYSAQNSADDSYEDKCYIKTDKSLSRNITIASIRLKTKTILKNVTLISHLGVYESLNSYTDSGMFTTTAYTVIVKDENGNYRRKTVTGVYNSSAFYLLSGLDEGEKIYYVYYGDVDEMTVYE